jgi:E3 ubiquitin-protein ligase UBR4
MLELLVSSKIISSNLPIVKVQEKIWREFVMSSNVDSNSAQNSAAIASLSMEQFPPMVVTYRLTGLDGEATEDVVEKLGDEEAEGTAQSDQYANADHVSASGLQSIVDATVSSISSTLSISHRDNTPSNLSSQCPESLTLLRCCLTRPSCIKLMTADVALVSLLMRLITQSTVSDAGDSVTMNTLVECIQQSSTNTPALSSGPSPKNSTSSSKSSQSSSGMLRMMLTSLEQDQFRSLLKTTPALINVVGRLIPTFITAENSKALAVTLSNQMSTFPLDVLGHVYLSIAANITETYFVNHLIESKFVDSVVGFVCGDAPETPPPTTPALHSPSTAALSPSDLAAQKTLWENYLGKVDLIEVFKCLVHLATFPEIQNHVTNTRLILISHWLAATSSSGDVGIEAEKFLEQIVLENNTTGEIVKTFQKELASRKKALADKRREEALAKMGGGAGGGDGGSKNAAKSSSSSKVPAAVTKSSPAAASKPAPPTAAIPAWMAEMEGMDEEEDPITCCTCGEGYSYSSGVLALYTFTSRVAISSTGVLEGNSLFGQLPASSGSLSPPLLGLWKTASACTEYSKYITNNTKTLSLFSCTSASNAIHVACHAKAVKADRAHPKAPKSEWEGSTLRNNRAKCNALLPLKKSTTSASEYVEACERYFSYVSAATGVTTTPSSSVTASASIVPRTYLCLHDLRLLVDTFAKGHSISELSKGGSISSNSHLLLRLVMFTRSTADTASFSGEAGPSRARALPSAFVFNASMSPSNSMLPPASTFAACCALVFETRKFWTDYKAVFLEQLLRDKSPSGGPTSSGRVRSSSFSEWETPDSAASGAGGKRKRVEDYTSVRARLIFFLLVDAAFQCIGDEELDNDQEFLDFAEDITERIGVIYRCGTMEELWKLQTTSKKPLDKIMEEVA